jgi:hypothetical protein
MKTELRELKDHLDSFRGKLENSPPMQPCGKGSEICLLERLKSSFGSSSNRYLLFSVGLQSIRGHLQ